MAEVVAHLSYTYFFHSALGLCLVDLSWNQRGIHGAIKLRLILTCNAALNTRRRELLISARERAISDTTVPVKCGRILGPPLKMIMNGRTVLVQVFAKRHAIRVCHSLNHEIKRTLCNANRAHAMVNTPGTMSENGQ